MSNFLNLEKRNHDTGKISLICQVEPNSRCLPPLNKVKEKMQERALFAFFTAETGLEGGNRWHGSRETVL